MNEVVFSSWAGKVIDNRGLSPDKYASLEDLGLPLGYDGHQVKAFMSWNGFVVVDNSVNVVDMSHSYLKEVEKLACGECSVGYLGIKVMVSLLGKILSGQGTDKDIDSLEQLATNIRANGRCDFCATAVTPVVDTLSYYKESYDKLVGSKGVVPKSTYVSRVTAPCTEACPAHQDIPGYIELIRNQRYEEALTVIRKTNCLPGMTGRACVAFCESNCCRASVDDAIAIRALKRVPADYEIDSSSEPTFEKITKRRAKVAVIGAGAAGLAASYNLALKGYKVTIYDELPSGGGMALIGIPPYRLPRDILSREVDIIEGLGVKIKPNTKVGNDLTLTDLLDDGFKAVFIATGAHIGRELGIEGEGVVDGVEFLHSVNSGKKIEPEDRVIIVGGGNVAIDCARTCVRLGFKNVTIVYRRSRAEMPARGEEVEEAEKEGVKINFLATPVKILTKGSQVTGAECIRMELGEPDASGRRRPIPISGSEFVITAGMIIAAVGEKPDLSFLGEAKPIKTDQGLIEIDQHSWQTSQAGIFAGGDCVSGPATLIEAIGDGNRAAKSIDLYLRTGNTVQSEEGILADRLHKIDLLARTTPRMVAKAKRQSSEKLSLEERQANFNEVENCFVTEEAEAEARRCLRCYRVMLLATT